MFVTHFGLRRRPFRTLPDTDGYYPATTHELALHDSNGPSPKANRSAYYAQHRPGKTLLSPLSNSATTKPSARLPRQRRLRQPPRSPANAALRIRTALPGPRRTGSPARGRRRMPEVLRDRRPNAAGHRRGPPPQRGVPRRAADARQLGRQQRAGRADRPCRLPSLWNRIDQTGMESLMQRLRAARTALARRIRSADYVLHQLRGGREEAGEALRRGYAAPGDAARERHSPAAEPVPAPPCNWPPRTGWTTSITKR